MIKNRIIGENISHLSMIPSNDYDKYFNSVTAILNGKRVKPFKSNFLSSEKESINVNIHISPVEFEGEIVAILINANGITPQEQLAESPPESLSLTKALDDKEILIRETHHRTKNNLLIIASLLHLTSADIDDENAKQIFSQTETRAKSMALIHDKLFQSGEFKQINFGDYIRQLAHDLFKSFLKDPDHVQLLMELQDLKLDINTAIPLGLILNELLTNSIKYAFPNGEHGTVLIKFYRKHNQYTMTVADNGIGLPPELDIDKTDTLGFRLINSLVGQIEGEFIDNRNTGTEIIIKFQEDNV